MTNSGDLPPAESILIPDLQLQELFEESLTIAKSSGAVSMGINHVIDALLAHHPETVEERLRVAGWTRPE